jgi:hypothetical protein
MLIVLLLLALAVGAGLGALASAFWFFGSPWSAIPRSNADFEWLDV